MSDLVLERPSRVALGQLLYAVLFVVVLPALLVWWAGALNRVVDLPSVGNIRIGVAIAAAGAAMMISATWALRRFGHGWPMSPYPPTRRVTQGAYAILDHPLYAGAFLLAVGWAVSTRNPAGLWIMSPLLALSCIAFVVGYERGATARRFGSPRRAPFLHLPMADDVRPAFSDRFSAVLLVFLPWLILYEAVGALGVPREVWNSYLRWESAIPVFPATEAIYFLAYPFALLAPSAARTRRDLREFMLVGWLATLVIIGVYLIVPVIALPKPVPQGGFFALMLDWERLHDSPVTAFPAFHVVWVWLAARLYAASVPRLRVLWFFVAVAITVACVTTGMHSIADVIAALAILPMLAGHAIVWKSLRVGSERIANSWHEWRVGRVRLLHHGAFAAASTFIGVIVLQAFAGPSHRIAIASITLCSILCAALWGQFVEGSSALLRPFGFFGALAGAMGSAALAGMFGSDAWLLLAALAVAAPFVQAIGRLRCLVQGCCHGRETESNGGIRYRGDWSRVVRANLSGVPLHPTPLYSMLYNVVLAAIGLRLWSVHAPLGFITGMYLILSGLARFVEEHYRGEPQTISLWGLRLYQWLAMATIAIGALMTVNGARPAPPPTPPSGVDVALAFALGLSAYVAYGVDFPNSNRRFSRLL